MCRLFGSRSQEPDGVAHELLHAANALRVQSREHADGWGLAWFKNGAPQVVRSLAPAHADADFETVSSYVHSTTILAHLRKASVGHVSLENTHPFQWGRWLFAHNGTLPEWDRTRGALENEIAPIFRDELRGDTDSERCFGLFLTHLARRGDPMQPRYDDVAAALDATVSDVRRLVEPVAGKAASTTFLVTNGSIMAAVRRGRTLHLCAPDADVHGHVPWMALSSEDPGESQRKRGSWVLLPEDCVVGVDADLCLHRRALAVDSRAA